MIAASLIFYAYGEPVYIALLIGSVAVNYVFGRILSAGPSCLPESVLQEAAQEMLDYKGTGQSVMEMSHRSKAYEPIIQDAEARIRRLMNIPDSYAVLFLQGGASTQFAMIPMNLKKLGKAAYIDTGVWSPPF